MAGSGRKGRIVCVCVLACMWLKKGREVYERRADFTTVAV